MREYCEPESKRSRRTISSHLRRGYRVELDLRSAVDSAVKTFSTVTTIDLTSSVESTWLDFIGAAVDSVDVDGASIPVEYDGSRIVLRGLGGSNVVRVAAHGHYSRSGEGLHRFVDDADDQTYLYTQYEPADARRVFACFEQPDLKAPFTFEVTAPDGWEVLSNQPATQTLSVDGAQRVTFAPTLPISTYITAIAAGPYHRVASSWSRGELTVELGALCRASLAPYLDAENVFDITRQGLDFYAEYFDYPYPFGKYDQIFVPEYNLGAMENPGLVTFTEAYVFRGSATDEQHQRRANTILHEMAHMWFGDLVTMVWWDDLWLKESFADFMGSLVSAEATRFTDAWVAFAIKRKAWAYLQDQLPTTHPSSPTSSISKLRSLTSTESPTPRAPVSSNNLWRSSGVTRSSKRHAGTSRLTRTETPRWSICSTCSRRLPGATCANGPESGCRPPGCPRCRSTEPMWSRRTRGRIGSQSESTTTTSPEILFAPNASNSTSPNHARRSTFRPEHSHCSTTKTSPTPRCDWTRNLCPLSRHPWTA